MSLQSATMPFPVRLRTQLTLDPVLLTCAVALLLGGLVIMASASVSVSDDTAGNAFYYVERQAIAA
ncbi:MAG: hypothetical protein WEA08_03880, partial [Woeseia sp.]